MQWTLWCIIEKDSIESLVNRHHLHVTHSGIFRPAPIQAQQPPCRHSMAVCLPSFEQLFATTPWFSDYPRPGPSYAGRQTLRAVRKQLDLLFGRAFDTNTLSGCWYPGIAFPTCWTGNIHFFLGYSFVRSPIILLDQKQTPCNSFTGSWCSCCWQPQQFRAFPSRLPHQHSLTVHQEAVVPCLVPNEKPRVLLNSHTTNNTNNQEHTPQRAWWIAQMTVVVVLLLVHPQRWPRKVIGPHIWIKTRPGWSIISMAARANPSGNHRPTPFLRWSCPAKCAAKPKPSVPNTSKASVPLGKKNNNFPK